MKKLIALVLALALVLASCAVAFADELPQGIANPDGTYGQVTTHNVKITNNDQHVVHSYEAYQVFKGNLSADEKKLSDIDWGTGVDGSALLSALKGTSDPALLDNNGQSVFKDATNATDVARILATFEGTSAQDATAVSSKIDAVATIIATKLTNTKVAFTTDDSDNTKYNATLPSDGYYFIKDVTANDKLDGTTGSDTTSKHLLYVVKDITIVAKDTGLVPDKRILDAVNGQATTTKVAADSSAIGDTITFSVEIKVPNTKKYEDHFWFVMKDKLDAGLTFTGIQSVKVGTDTYTWNDLTKSAPNPAINTEAYEGTAGYYTLKVGTDVPALNNDGQYAFEEASYDAVLAEGGQAIEITFNEFKKVVEKNDLIGKTITITYTAVLNDNAKVEGTPNQNEVKFVFSNDPNTDYDGDTPKENYPTGETPKEVTRTYSTKLKIKKVDENGNALPGATFKLTGNSLNRTVITGYKFVKAPYTNSGNGEEVDTTVVYWKLKDGSYTTTNPNDVTNKTQYEDVNETYYKVVYDYAEITPNETKSPLVITTDANGIAEFTGLREGTYTLEETNSPDGYNKIDGVSTFTITWSDPGTTDDGSVAYDIGGFSLAEATGNDDTVFSITWNKDQQTFYASIVNKQGVELPSTGGIGTTIFYILGGLLVVGAAVILVARRKAQD